MGNPDDWERLREYADTGNGTRWTMRHDARSGDRVAFYLTSPIAGLVATGRLSSDVGVNDDSRSPWRGQ